MDMYVGITIGCIVLCGIIYVIATRIVENKYHKNYLILYKKHNTVHVGETKSEVLFKIGNPQQKRKAENNRILWIYSLPYRKGKKLRFTLVFEQDVVISQSDIYQ